jgi:hypothetical protein
MKMQQKQKTIDKFFATVKDYTKKREDHGESVVWLRQPLSASASAKPQDAKQVECKAPDAAAVENMKTETATFAVRVFRAVCYMVCLQCLRKLCQAARIEGGDEATFKEILAKAPESVFSCCDEVCMSLLFVAHVYFVEWISSLKHNG